MKSITRRSSLLGAALLPLAIRSPPAAQSTKGRFTLDWKYHGVHARFNSIDYAKVKNVNIAANLQEQMLSAGSIDAILGFNYSIYINLKQAKLDPERDTRWFSYSDHGLDLYSNGVMASQALIQRD